MRDEDLFTVFEEMRLQELLSSGVLQFPDETFQSKKDSRVENQNLEPMEGFVLQEDDDIPYREVEAVRGAGVESASFNGVVAADEGDNGPLDDDGVNIALGAREQGLEEHGELGQPVDPVDGTHKTSVRHNSEVITRWHE